MADDMPADLRITDPYVRQLVDRIRLKRGGSGTPTKTATQLILERAAQLEMLDGRRPEDIQTTDQLEPSAA